MLTNTRRKELERLVYRLRCIVFDADEARAEKAGRVLRAVTARLREDERPERERAEKARRAAEAAKRQYVERTIEIARRGMTGDEAGDTHLFEYVVGGRHRAEQLARTYSSVRDQSIPRDPLVLAKRFAVEAQRGGFVAEAVGYYLCLSGAL